MAREESTGLVELAGASRLIDVLPGAVGLLPVRPNEVAVPKPSGGAS